jgi:SAM-dependent methyltransferase
MKKRRNKLLYNSFLHPFMGSSFVKQFYKWHLEKFGNDDIRSMGWHDELEYCCRFEIAVQLADLNNSSILDVGCGFGGLYKYLESSGIKFSYLGIDILPEMVEISKKNNPKGNFRVADILKEALPRFDYVFCLGAMNVSDKNHHSFFMKMVKRMISMAKKAVVLNFLSDKARIPSAPYHFENPEKLKKEILREFPDLKIEIVEDARIIGESFLFIYK